jgi:hypothetical protein
MSATFLSGTNGVHNAMDEAVDQLYSWFAPPAPAAAPLPEAACSANVYVLIGAHRVQVTLRGHDESEVLARVQRVIALYPDQPQSQPREQLSPQQHGALAQHKRVTDVCPVHGVTMRRNEKAGRSWYSHFLEDEGRWCKGR